MDLNGVSAVVSGGASGLGEATVRMLAAEGAKPVIADLNEDKGKALADEVGGVFVKTDVSDEAQVQAAVQAAVDTGKPLRVIVNSAGIGWASRTVNRDGSPHDLGAYAPPRSPRRRPPTGAAFAEWSSTPRPSPGSRARPARSPTRPPRAASSA